MKGERGFRCVAHVVMMIAALAALIPFILLVVASFTEESWALANGFSFFPGKWSADAYLYIANQWQTIGHAYLMTFVVTAIGTFCSIMMTSLFAYGLSSRDIPGTKIISFLVIFTMLFNGGLVATYYTYSGVFHIRNTIWGLIIPNLMMNAFNIILVKNYFATSIPDGLLEAARIDGANEFQIFFKIAFPLSKPILATIGLMTGISYWNDWQNGLYYLSQREGSQFYTIQVVLNTINENINFLATNPNGSVTSVTSMPTTTARMAIAVIGILPILIVYPFFQKYFVKGITLGGVKG